jgi:hypothetical protein
VVLVGTLIYFDVIDASAWYKHVTGTLTQALQQTQEVTTKDAQTETDSDDKPSRAHPPLPVTPSLALIAGYGKLDVLSRRRKGGSRLSADSAGE